MYKTAEWVSPKHPDKMADQISDAILDWCLEQDSNARVAVEAMGGHGKVYITGEITINSVELLDSIGLIATDIVHRITGKDEEVFVNIVGQSREIANGVDTGGAGDQGIMVGYACNDNEAMIPQELYLARSLGEFIYKQYPYDGKTQITLGDDNYISVIVASFQNVSSLELREMIEEWIDKVEQPHAGVVIHCNPAGDWNIGGFDADTGLTGRKLAVDNYGPQIPIGGGAFSGKDATKVDRSGAYMARKIARDIVSKEIKNGSTGISAFVKLAYAIGKAEPVMATIELDTDNGNKIIDLLKAEHGYNLTPKGIINFLKLREPKYEETARSGHFGKGFEWDK